MKFWLIVVVSLLAGAVDAADKPNIIVIYADDMGYGDCTVNNPESKISTPNLDRLAREGMRFTDAHSPSSTCTASRYGLLTGTCPVRRGVVNGLTGLGPVIDQDEVTIADVLKDQGYVTWMVGKWHLGFELLDEGSRGKSFDFSRPLVGGPLDCGFESFFGLPKAPSGPPYFFIRGREPVARPTEQTPGTKRAAKANGTDSRATYAGGEIAPGFVPERCNTQLCDDVVRMIRESARSDSEQPFFLYYAMLEPHVPWLPTDDFIGRSNVGRYGDYIVQLDHEVGRVLAALRESGREQETLVIFSSDNGAQWSLKDIEQFGHRANGRFSGSKGTAYEGGHRVPFVVRWPGKVPASTVTDALINHTDLFATLAEILNVDMEKAYPDSAPDSYSFRHVLGTPDAEHRRPGMTVTPGSYRQGAWKLRFRRMAGGSVDRMAPEAVLHNLKEDPAETTDRSDANPEIKSRLFEEYLAFVDARKLKPLAVQVAARKSEKKARPPRIRPEGQRSDPKVTGRSTQIPDGLSREQRARLDRLTKEYASRIADLQKKLDDVLSDKQKEARRAGQKKALAEGKRGVKLRAAADAAAKMTDEQQKLVAELRQRIGQLTRERRVKLEELLKGAGSP